jgi:hypothetical protein
MRESLMCGMCVYMPDLSRERERERETKGGRRPGGEEEERKLDKQQCSLDLSPCIYMWDSTWDDVQSFPLHIVCALSVCPHVLSASSPLPIPGRARNGLPNGDSP